MTTTADRTLYWFARTYGLDFADAERMAAYEAETDAGHATRVSILMSCDKLSFDAALAIVAQTDTQFDREELAESRSAIPGDSCCATCGALLHCECDNVAYQQAETGLINQYGEPADPYAPLGACAICGADAWTTAAAGLLCPSHDAVLDEMEPEGATITIKRQAFIVNFETGRVARAWQLMAKLTVAATRNPHDGYMEFNVDGSRFYVMEADDYEVAA